MNYDTTARNSGTKTFQWSHIFYRHLGEAIRLMREKRGWTQAQLAKKIGTKQSSVARLERSKIPSLLTLQRVAIACGATMSLPYFVKK